MDNLPTNKSSGDAAQQIGKAVLSAVPIAGGPLAVLFENIFTAPLEKRKEQLAGVINELQTRVEDLTPEKLSENEAFITVTLQASQIALRNHQSEKLNALRAAILHSALPNAPEENLQQIFLRLIDQLTPWHLGILAMLHDPVHWMLKNEISNPNWGMGGVSTVIEHCFPQLKGQRELYDHIVRELQAESLIMQGNFLHVTMSRTGMIDSRTTKIAATFLHFITDD